MSEELIKLEVTEGAKIRALVEIPFVDRAFPMVSEVYHLPLAVAFLRRHTIYSDDNGSVIGYYFHPTACAEQLINWIHSCLIRPEILEDSNPAKANELTILMMRTANDMINKHVLSDDVHNRLLPSMYHRPPDTELPFLALPKMSSLDNLITPDQQFELIQNPLMKRWLPAGKYIADAFVFENNVIFLIGDKPGDYVFINELLQNEVIHVIYAEQTSVRIIGAATYRLNDVEIWNDSSNTSSN